MKIPEINKICYVGAGTMGCANAMMAALAGYETVLYDIAKESLAQVPGRLLEVTDYLQQNGYAEADDIALAMTRVSTSSSLEAALTDVDLVSESVLERLDVKHQVHDQLDQLCAPPVIVTTNTSNIPLSSIAEVVVHRERFAALHSHLGSPLIDIVGTAKTSAGTVDILTRYVESINCIPLVLKKENPGYVLNAMLGPVLTIAMMLVIEGVATIEEVDRAWMQHRRAPIGPFGMMDAFGLNIIDDSWQQREDDEDNLKAKITGFLAPYMVANTLGLKSSKGFYQYPDPIYQQAEFFDSDKDLSFVHSSIAAVLISNAVTIAEKDVAEPQEIDRAWMAATHLDIGPFGIMDELGTAETVALFEQLAGFGLLPPQAVTQLVSFLQSYTCDRGAPHE